MAATFETLLTSRLYRFEVAHKKHFVVHEAAVASQAPALQLHLTQGLSGGGDGAVKWPSCDGDTFVRFAQFCYTGDYSVPSAVKVESPVEPGRAEEAEAAVESEPATENGGMDAEPVDEPIVHDGSPARATPAAENVASNGVGYTARRIITGRKKKTATVTRWDDDEQPVSSLPGIISAPKPPPLTRKFASFSKLQYKRPDHPTKFEGTCELIVPASADQSFKDVLLCHARLNVLAEKWGIESLTQLTLAKMLKTLTYLDAQIAATGDLDDGSGRLRAEEVSELIRYLYSKGIAQRDNGKLNRMCELVWAYFTEEAVVFLESEPVLDLLAEGGLFMRDAAGFLRERLLFQ